MPVSLQVGLLAEIRAYEKSRKQRRVARQRERGEAEEEEEEEEEGEIGSEEAEPLASLPVDRLIGKPKKPGRGEMARGGGGGGGRGGGRGGQLPRSEQYGVSWTRPLCRHWKVGRCTRGAGCDFSHDCTPVTKLHIPCRYATNDHQDLTAPLSDAWAPQALSDAWAPQASP